MKFQQRFAGLFFTKIGKIVVMLQLLKDGGLGGLYEEIWDYNNLGFFTLVLHVRRALPHFDVP